MIENLVKFSFADVDRKIEIIEEICRDIITELKRPKIIKNVKSDFLLDYGPEIQRSIVDEKLRNWSPWLD